jgi:hypothetical protein
LGLLRAGLAGWPLQNGLFWQPSLARELRRRAPELDAVVLLLARLAGHFGDAAAAGAVLVDFVDSLSLNVARRAAVDRRFERPLLRLEARRLARCESRLLSRAAAGAVVCDRDRDAMAGRVDEAVARRLAVVPLAVTAGSGGDRTSPAERSPEHPLLVFTGNLGYFVNDDALRWWLDSVWPALVERVPLVRLLVAGQRPAAALRRAIGRAGGELVVEPPSLPAILERATLALAPLRCGSGIPVKILEAWQAGVPVVASRWAAAGTAGRDGFELLVADSTDEWVKCVERLIGDAELRRRLATAGGACLLRHYSLERAAESLEGWLLRAATGRRPPRPR